MRRFRPAPKIHFAFVCSEAQPYRSQSACLLLEHNDASGILAGYTIPAQRKNRSNENHLGTWQFRFPNFIAVGDPRIKTDLRPAKIAAFRQAFVRNIGLVTEADMVRSWTSC